MKKATLQPQINPKKQGVWRTYDVTDGLPSSVWCLRQDHEGHLWLGTRRGLCRYDGAEFLTYTTADGLAADIVWAIHFDRYRRLWVSTGEWWGTGISPIDAGGVSMFDGERFITYTTADGLAHNEVLAICEDQEGRLWFGTEGGGVSCFDGQCFTSYTTADGLAHNNVMAIDSDHLGRLWFGTEGGVSAFDGQRFTTYTTADGLAHNHVEAVCLDRLGRLWFGTRGGGVCCFDGERFTGYTTADGLAHNSVCAICEDQDGRLWFGTRGGGVSCYDGKQFVSFTVEDGLLDNNVTDIVEDMEGGFWFAHFWSGLTRLDAQTWQFLTDKPVSEILIEDAKGRLWFGDENNLVCLVDGQERLKLFAEKICALLEDSKGRLWVGTRGDGLYRYESPEVVWKTTPETAREIRHFTAVDGLGHDKAMSLLETRDGTIWVGTSATPSGIRGSLCRFCPPGDKGRAFVAIPTPHPVVFRLYEDSHGRIWMGGVLGGGLSCYDGKQLVTYTEADGLPGNSFMSIVEDDAGRLWMGTDKGLCWFDGQRFTTFGKEEGLLSLNHQCSTKDAKGHLWFGTLMGGLYRYDGKHFQWLTTSDGLPGNSITGLAPQPDGSMIIGTYRGIVHYHPTATVPPRIEIQEVVADEVYRNPSELELTADDAGLLTISYRGLSLSTQKMRYSYILEGYDAKWQDTWERSVRYENLPVGDYTFKVIAINRDLVESEAPATLKLTISPDVTLAALQTEVNQLRREIGDKYHFDGLIGRSAAMKQVRALMEKAIDSGVTVLITGQTGTGKELVAKAIRANSSRRDKPSIEINCGAVPKELIPSTLFGHRKGAFTGAHEDRIGLFEAANEGTLIMDEIGEMPLEAQAALLRVLQERRMQRLGETRLREVDVRVIAVTNRNLAEEIRAGRFREDLYHRLRLFPIHVPSLRDRADDIPILAEHFLEKACVQLNKEIEGFAPGVVETLQSYAWPGNVRELENEVHRAAILAQEGFKIQAYHFSPEAIQESLLAQDAIAETSGYSEAVDRFRKLYIEQTLKECDGNRHEAARRLRMHRSNLLDLIRRLKIEV